jgi:hypothetical protein
MSQFSKQSFTVEKDYFDNVNPWSAIYWPALPADKSQICESAAIHYTYFCFAYWECRYFFASGICSVAK